LGEVCDRVRGTIRTGPFGSQLHESDYVDDGIPVVMPKNIIDGRIDTRDIAYIDEATAARLAAHRMKPGDIVYGRRGDIGRRALITAREAGWLCGTVCLRISLGDAELDPVFLFYYLGAPDVTAWIQGQAIGATLPNLNTSILRSVSVTFPPLPTQRKIADILSAYDDLIENNTRRIAILEEMAQRLYREWFVHFRYPGHESVPLVESELGPIPEGWEVKRLGDVLELAYGKALKAEDRTEGSVSVYGSSGIVGKHDSWLVKGPGIIIGRKGNVGSVHWSAGDFFPIDTVFYVKSDMPLNYLYYLLKEQPFLNSDAAVPGLNRSQALSHHFVMPRTCLISMLQDTLEPLFELVQKLQAATVVLREARDFLLPKLLAGDVHITACPEPVPPNPS
jgi:type I restriction enzyme, S subunit